MRLIKTSTLIALALVSLVLFGAMRLWIDAANIPLIDTITSEGKLTTTLASMSDAARASHKNMTLALDVLFPLAYGSLFAGLAVRFFGRAGVVLALPALTAMIADIIENIALLNLLRGEMGWLSAKLMATQTKNVAFALAALIALLALFEALRRRIKPEDF